MIFKRNKEETRKLPDRPLVYPIGSAIKTENGWYYIKSVSVRMRIPTQAILNSWNFHRIITSNELSLKNYKIMGKLGFRQGSLLYNIADGKIYLVEDNKLRHIQSPEALELIGAGKDEAVTVSDAEIKYHEIGLPLS
jgi:hypothetical protein